MVCSCGDDNKESSSINEPHRSLDASKFQSTKAYDNFVRKSGKLLGMVDPKNLVIEEDHLDVERFDSDSLLYTSSRALTYTFHTLAIDIDESDCEEAFYKLSEIINNTNNNANTLMASLEENTNNHYSLAPLSSPDSVVATTILDKNSIMAGGVFGGANETMAKLFLDLRMDNDENKVKYDIKDLCKNNLDILMPFPL